MIVESCGTNVGCTNQVDRPELSLIVELIIKGKYWMDLISSPSSDRGKI